MKRYDSKPIPLPPISPQADAGDIIFYGVGREGASYEARVFLNNTKADVDTPRELSEGFVGVFTVFGHGGCVGDEGHCDRPEASADPFDLRLPQGLVPLTKTVMLSAEALKRLTGDDFTVTVVAVEPSDKGPAPSEALEFESWRLAAYEP
jgi:hypothetical protein